MIARFLAGTCAACLDVAVRARYCLLLVTLASSLALAEPPGLRQRLATASAAPEAPITEGALRQAREALARAEEREDPAAAERARRIADAALTLAERRIALARARAGRRDAERHRDQARRRAATAREALAHARQPAPTTGGGALGEAEE